MPARRKNYRSKSRPRGKKLDLGKAVILAIPIIVFIGIIVLIAKFLIFGSEYKFPVVVVNSDGEVNVVVFDGINSEIIAVQIPGNVEIDAAYNLGRWKIKNIYKLGDQQGYGGGYLLTKSIAKTFAFPVYSWVKIDTFGNNLGLEFSDIVGLILRSDNNLGAKDKLRMAWLAFRVSNSKRILLDISDTQYLKPTTLSDGEKGYVVTNSFPNKYYSYFSSTELIKQNPKIVINDYTGDTTGSADSVSKIVEVMGSKVNYVYKKSDANFKDACQIRSRKMAATTALTNVFGCTYSETDNPAVVEINLGEEFKNTW